MESSEKWKDSFFQLLELSSRKIADLNVKNADLMAENENLRMLLKSKRSINKGRRDSSSALPARPYYSKNGTFKKSTN